jgi:hypothetical protein
MQIFSGSHRFRFPSLKVSLTIFDNFRFFLGSNLAKVPLGLDSHLEIFPKKVIKHLKMKIKTRGIWEKVEAIKYDSKDLYYKVFEGN